MSEKPILGYWNTHGIAQPIRYMLKYVGVDFIDKKYQMKDIEGPPNEDTLKMIRADWNPVKHTLGLEFPNLPYYIDGDIKITQSLAIMKYLARKHGLIPEDEASRIRVDMAEGIIGDFFSNMWRELILNPNFGSSKDKFITEKLPVEVDNLARLLGNNKWVVGDKITHVDFLLYESIYWIRLFGYSALKKHSNLIEFLRRFKSLPAIEAYLKSEDYSDWPLTNPFCRFGWRK